MRHDVKALADAMERGWKLYPRNTAGYTYFVYEDHIAGFCPLGHACVGVGIHADIANANSIFSVLLTQNVAWLNEADLTLSETIIELADAEGWTTPQVIAWLRTHENDV